MELYNQTPFSAEQMLIIDENGGDILSVVVKATYQISDEGITIADDQKPVILADEYYGEPGASSIKYESETAFAKPGTDIVLIGSAYAPNDHTEQLDAIIKVGNISKNIRVFGDRYWDRIFGIWFISDPEPFDRIPLVFEKSYGGWNSDDQNKTKEFYDTNPVGTGYMASKNKSKRLHSPLPNLEDPNFLITSPATQPLPAGFGFISPNWQPRLSFAGTYDDSWKKNRMPLLPLNFNRKFFNSAHPDLISPRYIKGGEPVELIHLTPNPKCAFSLPEIFPEMTVCMHGNQESQQILHLDTLIFNTDKNLLFIIWRNSINIYDKINKVLWTEVKMISR
jgi:hypothetical protein